MPEPEDGFPRRHRPADPEAANIAGGGGLYTENGPVEIDNLTFTGNTATDEGGGLSIDNFGDVRIERQRHSRATTPAPTAAAIENSGFRVTFERLHDRRQPRRARRRRHLQLVEQPVLHPRHATSSGTAPSTAAGWPTPRTTT